MDIFPIGTVAAATSCGLIDGKSYSMFEPNNGAKSNKVYTNLVTTMYDQTKLTRKKALPYITLSYNYSGIWAKEYRQLAHFIDSKEDNLNPFYVVDFSEQIDYDSVASLAGKWVIDTEETRYFSAIANQKSSYVFIWDGSKFRIGDVSSITVNASISVDISTNNYGSLSFVNASINGYLYPIYECYLDGNSLKEFDKGEFVDVQTSERGFTRTGNIGFTSKYKV